MEINGLVKIRFFDDIPSDITDKFEKLSRLFSAVNNNSDIKKWVSKTYK